MANAKRDTVAYHQIISKQSDSHSVFDSAVTNLQIKGPSVHFIVATW